MKILTTLACVGASALAVNGAQVIVDNLDIAAPITLSAQSNYRVQSFTPNIAGTGASDTVASNIIPISVFLQSATFERAPGGTSGAGLIYINVYSGPGNGGTFLGSSTNAIDVNNTAFSERLTWNFDNIVLADSSTEYGLVFSSDTTDGNDVQARLTAADAGSGSFVNTYDGGTADGNDADNSSPNNFDAKFAVTYETIPEPSSTALLGLGGLALLLRRRK